jgi:hypothetical protein
LFGGSGGLLAAPALSRDAADTPEPLHKLMALPWSSAELAKLPAVELPADSPVAELPLEERPALTPEPAYKSEGFQWLREYVQAGIKCGRETRPEWKAILGLELSHTSRTYQYMRGGLG